MGEGTQSDGWPSKESVGGGPRGGTAEYSGYKERLYQNNLHCLSSHDAPAPMPSQGGFLFWNALSPLARLTPTSVSSFMGHLFLKDFLDSLVQVTCCDLCVL